MAIGTTLGAAVAGAGAVEDEPVTSAVGGRKASGGTGRAPSPGAGPQVTTLDSGRRVVTDAVAGGASATVVALVGVGGRDEPEYLAGASHFLEHLLCKGSASRPSAEVAESVDAVGGELDAVTDRERTAVQVRVPAADAAFALDLLGDLVVRPALRPDEVEVERRVILEELAQAEEDPEDRAHTLSATCLYGAHPLGREVLGDRRTLKEMGRADISSFHAARYRPEAMVVAAAGAVDHDTVVALVERWDDEHARKTASDAAVSDAAVSLTEPRLPPESLTPSTKVLRRAGEQVHLVLGWPLGAVAAGDRAAWDVLVQVLGGGPASRLFRSVRDERGLAYAVDASLSMHSDAAALTAYAGCSPRAVAEVRAVVGDEVERLATDGPTVREVEVAIGYLAGSSTLALEDSGIRAWRVGIEELERGGARPAAERIDEFRQVAVDDTRRVAAILGTAPSVVAVGPVSRRTRL